MYRRKSIATPSRSAFMVLAVLYAIAVARTNADADVWDSPRPPLQGSFLSYHHDHLIISRDPRNSLSLPVAVVTATLTNAERNSLVGVQFYNCDLDELVGVLDLSRFPKLRNVEFVRCHIGEFALHSILTSARFNHLNFQECSIDSRHLCLKHPLNVLTVGFEKCRVDHEDAVLKGILQCPNLFSLNIHECQIQSVKWISHDCNLTTVGLSDNRIMHIDSRTMGFLRKASHLYLDGNPDLTVEFPFHLKDFLTETLALDSTRINDSTLTSASQLPMLRVLGICKTTISSDGVSALANSMSVIRISANDTNLVDNDLSALCGIQQLRVLEIAGCTVTDKNLECLEKMPNLKSVNFSRTKITPKRVVEFAKSASVSSITYNSPNIRQLNSAVIQATQGRAAVYSE